MNPRQANRKTSTKPAVLVPPRWLSRAEKHEFRRLLDARNDAGNPVSATEQDALCDYVAARSQLALLRKMAKVAVWQCRCNDDLSRQLNPFGYTPSQKHALLLMRSVNAAVAQCRVLARDLRLIEIEG